MDIFCLFIKCVVSASIEIVLQQTNAKNFMTKIRAFEKNVKTSQKNKSTDTFFEQLFIFETGKRKIDTPIKRKLKQTVHSLKKSKKSLMEENILLKEDIQNVVSEKLELNKEVDEYKYLDQSIELHEEEENRLLSEVAEKDDEIGILKARIDELTNTKMQLNQQIRGIKSGIKRRQATFSPLPSTSATTSSTKSNTEITNINNDIITVTDKLNRGFFRGVRYFGEEAQFKRKSDGHVRTYAELPDSKKPCSMMTKKELQKRVHFIEDVSEHCPKVKVHCFFQSW